MADDENTGTQGRRTQRKPQDDQSSEQTALATPASNGNTDVTSDTDEVFTREQVLTDSYALVGIEPFVVAGALVGNDDETFSRDQIRNAVSSFLSREVTR